MLVPGRVEAAALPKADGRRRPHFSERSGEPYGRLPLSHFRFPLSDFPLPSVFSLDRWLGEGRKKRYIFRKNRAV
jgi:hypothetical protein